MLVNKVMADNRLDALVYPTKTIPAPLLAAPVEPTTLKSVKETVTLTIEGQQYDRVIERVVDLRASLTPRLSPNGGFPVVVVPAGFTREVYDRAVVVGRRTAGKTAGDLLAAETGRASDLDRFPRPPLQRARADPHRRGLRAGDASPQAAAGLPAAPRRTLRRT